MKKKKSRKIEKWFVCYDCNEWYTKKSIDELKQCPNCGGRLVEVCGRCRKPADICLCRRAS